MSLKHKVALARQFSVKFYRLLKKEGFTKSINKVRARLSTNLGFNKEKKKNNPQMNTIYNEIANRYVNGQIKGFCVLPSAMEFEELYNQRTINLAKYMSEKGYAVLYVTWQWEENQPIKKAYKNVYKNIYEVPMYDFIYSIEAISKVEHLKNKLFISTLPAKIFYKQIPILRKQNFKIIYDILDEWEEFFKVGQASWFIKKIEEQFVEEADFVFAVSRPLKDKFKHLKESITVIGNGYNPELSKNGNVALKSKSVDNYIHVGYFGHMTSSWFDWDLIFYILKQEHITLHLIGHGAPDEKLELLENYNNVKFYGKIHPSELNQYVANWHIGIIPFKWSKLSEAVDPIKIYEYLYFGLPTVSTGIPHIGEYPDVQHCTSKEEVVDKIRTIYDEVISTGMYSNFLQDFLQETTWDNRFARMLKEINGD